MIGVQSKQNCHCMVQFPVSRKKCYNIFICIIPPPLLFLKIILFPQYIKNHCNKLKICNSFIFATWWCKPLIFKTEIKWSNRIDRLKYLKVKDVELQRYKDCGKLNFFIEKWEIITFMEFLIETYQMRENLSDDGFPQIW